jgi:recombinational DNA repair protein (RecF pathway)
MTEHYTPAVVLSRAPRNESDLAVALYTKKLGRVNAVVKGARKITSKLSGHLQPGSLVDARIIDKGSFQLVDVLSRGKLCPPSADFIRFLNFMDDMTPYTQPDMHLWHILEVVLKRCQPVPSVYRQVLETMGFLGAGPDSTPLCQNCERPDAQVAYFYAPDIMFLCSKCVLDSKVDQDETVPIA